MPDLNIEKALEIIIIEMHKKSMLPIGVNLREVVDKIVAEFKNNDCKIDLNDLQHPENMLAVRKALMFSIASEAIAMEKPELRVDYMMLFKTFDKEDLKNNPEKLSAEEKKLKEQFKKSLTAINNKLEPGMRLSDKELDELAEILARAAMKQLLNNDKQKSLAHNADMPSIQLALIKALESLYGSDPHVAGKVAKPVLRVIGNYAAQQDLNTGGGPSFMGEQSTFNPGSVDYTGKEGTTTLQYVMQVGMLAEALTSALASVMSPPEPKSHLPNPFSTTPRPEN